MAIKHVIPQWGKNTIFLSSLACSILIAPNPGKAYTVFCTNCSTVFTQLLDRVTNVSQLQKLTQQYAEDIQQTAQQIQLVQRAIQNTMQLPQTLRGQLTGQLAQLASLTSQLKTQRGDISALAQVFNQLFPEQSEFANLSAASTEAEKEAANQTWKDHQDTWSAKIDQAAQATFQLSGKQLDDLADAGELETYIQSLLNTPDGQMQAMQAGNQLAALQIQEFRQLRELMATSAQSTLTASMKKEKTDQMATEEWRTVTGTSDKYNDLSGYDATLQ